MDVLRTLSVSCIYKYVEKAFCMINKIATVIVMFMMMVTSTLLYAQEDGPSEVPFGVMKSVDFDLGRKVVFNVPESCESSQEQFETADGVDSVSWMYRNQTFVLALYDNSGRSYEPIYVSYWGDQFDQFVSEQSEQSERKDMLAALNRYKQLSDYELCRRVYDRSIEFNDIYEQRLRNMMRGYTISQEFLDNYAYGEWHYSDGMVISWIATGVESENRRRVFMCYGFVEGKAILDGMVSYDFDAAKIEDSDLIKLVFSDRFGKGVSSEKVSGTLSPTNEGKPGTESSEE